MLKTIFYRYSKAKLGNWCEDQDAVSIKLAEFLSQKANNSLKVEEKKSPKLEKSYQNSMFSLKIPHNWP